MSIAKDYTVLQQEIDDAIAKYISDDFFSTNLIKIDFKNKRRIKEGSGLEDKLESSDDDFKDMASDNLESTNFTNNNDDFEVNYQEAVAREQAAQKMYSSSADSVYYSFSQEEQKALYEDSNKSDSNTRAIMSHIEASDATDNVIRETIVNGYSNMHPEKRRQFKNWTIFNRDLLDMNHKAYSGTDDVNYDAI